MASDRDLLAIALKQHAINDLTLLNKELEQQFDKWTNRRTGFLDLLVAAHDDAAKDQADMLKAHEEEQRRSWERSMFVLQLISIGAVAWLGAALELKLGPKLFSAYGAPPVGSGGLQVWLPKKWLPRIPDEFKAKWFGDMGKDLAGLFVEKGRDSLAPGKSDLPPDEKGSAATIAYSPNAAAFGQRLWEEVNKQKLAVTSAVNHLAEVMNSSATIGDALVMKLYGMNPRIARQNRQAQEIAGYKMIDDTLDKVREKWATDYYYYGYEPPAQINWGRVRRQIERQLWAIWILQQNFHLEKAAGVYIILGSSGGVLSKTGGFASAIEDNVILERLSARNAAVMSLILEGVADVDRGKLQERLDTLVDWAKRLNPKEVQGALEGVERTLGPIGAIWE